MRPGRFVILVEVLERELPAQVLLGKELVRRGHGVWLVDKATFHANPTNFPPSVVLAKSLSKSCFGTFQGIRRAGHKIAVLGQEAILDGDPENFLSRRVFARTLELVDLLCFWGENHRRVFAHLLSPDQRYLITGNPRFDLLHPRFRGIWDEVISDIKRTYGKRVVITTRFSLVNHFKRSLEENVARKIEKSYGNAAQSFDRWLKGMETVFKRYSDGLMRLTEQLSDVQFVLRPKPRENLDYWISLFAGKANVKVVLDGSAIPWLGAAQCVVHNACTTGIEAFLLNRPVMEFHPAKAATSELDPSLPGRITGSVDNVERLAEWLKLRWEDGSASEITPPTQASLADQFHGYEEAFAHICLADGLEKLGETLNFSSKCDPASVLPKHKLPQPEINALLERFADLAGEKRRIGAFRDGDGVRIG